VRALQGPLTIHLPKNRVWDDDTILALSAENPELRFEQTAQGDLVIMPPAGTETGDRDSEINMQLRLWSKQDNLGRVFSSQVLDFLMVLCALLMLHG
jgi:Uma2 family endonuclease